MGVAFSLLFAMFPWVGRKCLDDFNDEMVSIEVPRYFDDSFNRTPEFLHSADSDDSPDSMGLNTAFLGGEIDLGLNRKMPDFDLDLSQSLPDVEATFNESTSDSDLEFEVVWDEVSQKKKVQSTTKKPIFQLGRLYRKPGETLEFSSSSEEFEDRNVSFGYYPPPWWKQQIYFILYQ